MNARRRIACATITGNQRLFTVDAAAPAPHNSYAVTDERCLNYSQNFIPNALNAWPTPSNCCASDRAEDHLGQPAKVTDALITRAHEKAHVRLIAQPRGLLTAIRPIIRILMPTHAVPLVAPCARWNSLGRQTQLFPVARPAITPPVSAPWGFVFQQHRHRHPSCPRKRHQKGGRVRLRRAPRQRHRGYPAALKAPLSFRFTNTRLPGTDRRV